MVERYGLDVIIHVPLLQPTHFQYKNPTNAPTMEPTTTHLFL